VKLKPNDGDTQRGWPGHILWGRMRTSTAALIIAFIALVWVYENFTPQSSPEPVAPQIVPPGFVPDPDYTWVPRTQVAPRTTTTTTTTPPTTTETTPTETPTETDEPNPFWPFPPPTTTSPGSPGTVDPDGPGPLPPRPVTTTPTSPVRTTPTTTTATPTVPGIFQQR